MERRKQGIQAKNGQYFLDFVISVSEFPNHI